MNVQGGCYQRREGASACWPRPGEDPCKEFPKLVAKEQKYSTDDPLPKFPSHGSKVTDLQAGRCPSARTPGALFGGKTHFSAWSHTSSWMAGGFWFLAILFSFVQSGRGPWVRQEARGGGTRPPVGSVVWKNLTSFCFTSPHRSVPGTPAQLSMSA